MAPGTTAFSVGGAGARVSTLACETSSHGQTPRLRRPPRPRVRLTDESIGLRERNEKVARSRAHAQPSGGRSRRNATVCYRARHTPTRNLLLTSRSMQEDCAAHETRQLAASWIAPC